MLLAALSDPVRAMLPFAVNPALPVVAVTLVPVMFPPASSTMAAPAV